MEYTKVQSASIQGVHYDKDTKQLTVKFVGGQEYSYDKVPQRTATRLINAKSHGKFFHKHIKPKFTFTKV